VGEHPQREIHRLTNLLLSRLDEDHRRWYVALESLKIGHGGDRWLSRITGMNVETIRRGRRELADSLAGFSHDRIRRRGAGRKPKKKKTPDLISDLLALVEEHTGGNPMGPQKWVRRSLRNLCRDLTRHGHKACAATVGKLLRDHDYAPKANRKRFTGPRHPDRDRQFRWIARQRKTFLTRGLPVISVDLKKKELVGNFKNAGQSWCQEAEEVGAYDFPSDALGVALPYGIYLINRQRGYVEVGTSAATPEFAVDVIARWWASRGRVWFPKADRLLILADSGGNNGCRPRLWKLRLQEQLADRFGLKVTICHYPKGASKYNPVERRLFSRISDNWAGKPLRSYPVLLAYVRGTKTETGLRVEARLNRSHYRTKIKVSDQEMRALNLNRHRTCPQWNYTIKPRSRGKGPPENESVLPHE